MHQYSWKVSLSNRSTVTLLNSVISRLFLCKAIIFILDKESQLLWKTVFSCFLLLYFLICDALRLTSASENAPYHHLCLSCAEVWFCPRAVGPAALETQELLHRLHPHWPALPLCGVQELHSGCPTLHCPQRTSRMQSTDYSQPYLPGRLSFRTNSGSSLFS